MFKSAPRVLLLLLIASAGASCGTKGFDPATKIDGLRILAVQKDPPYGKAQELADPPSMVTLKLLYWDGRADPSAPRPIAHVWLGAPPLSCFNPAGDLYYGCYGQFAAEAASLGADAGAAPDAGAAADATALTDASGDAESADATALTDASGDAESADATAASVAGALPADPILTYTIPIPQVSEIIKHSPGGVTPYGLAYAFVAVCAGQLDIARESDAIFPVGCYDANHQPLGPGDFDVAYTAIYVYSGVPPVGPSAGPSDWERLHNTNPVITGLAFDGQAVADASGRLAVAHVPRCVEPNADNCPTRALKAAIAGPAELDPDARGPNGEAYTEQMWVSYFATRGSFTHDALLVNDPSKGWNEDNGTAWRIPTEAGPARIWAIVKDNRGGTAWTEVDVIVDP